MDFILLYYLDDELKVEYFKSVSGLEETYNAIQTSFGKRFKLEFAGSIKNRLEFKRVRKNWEKVSI